MLVSRPKLNQKVEFPMPKLSEFAVGKIIKIEDKGKGRKEVGYKIRIEKPDELRNRIVYIPRRFIRRTL